KTEEAKVSNLHKYILVSAINIEHLTLHAVTRPPGCDPIIVSS
ncbi:unnamed protein product, partial [Brassica rapa subsp. trilocularis]